METKKAFFNVLLLAGASFSISHVMVGEMFKSLKMPDVCG